ncbi:murein biosynthesis integral membrane protein MurJ [Roseospira marina]|uniref:Probable lipid II flippase MurJ n=1 Tax=Roseospira marina TaxID=140057 RepID=A0A5M6I9D7_9PROT|nr:murein biosynthesis integral membrane protein MurJ [Roseospira marina]KAA5604894.1 murein biosynthesis integral membrane protein MurJ [Roseospira marina]MBB4315233.1 putative peptidoglycan lipid II flippase [Roseospira marina]MBB5088233.1 putative peptidoglycan lipid II flippase [Roseospira marina]
MALLRSIATVGGYTLLSRLTGFARDILVAGTLGAGTVSDAFFVAFRFPNLFRRLFAEGAFQAAFVPLFAGTLETDGPEQARLFARRAFSVLALVLLVFTAALEVLMPFAMIVMAPGFDAVPGKMELATELTRIAFPYLLFISLVSLQSGVLNSLGHFAAAAAAPILLNLTLIAALVGFTPMMETPGHALAWGVFAAGVIQFAWLAWHCLRAGMTIAPIRPALTARVRLLGRRIVPVVLGGSLYQINLLIGTILASLLADGAVSWLYYADRVTQLPLGVVGVAVSTALLPLLSRQLKGGQWEHARHNQNRALEVALLLTLPAAAALMVIPGPIIGTLFERGAFSPADTAATAAALVAFASGLPSYVLVKILAQCFFAREDTAMPVRIAAAAMAANIALNVALMQVWGHVGIALAASLSNWGNAIALGVVLHRRGQLGLDARFLERLPRIALATVVMAGAVAGGTLVVADLLAAGDPWRPLALAALVVVGAVVYAGVAQVSGAARLGEIKAMLRRGEPATPGPIPPDP